MTTLHDNKLDASLEKMIRYYKLFIKHDDTKNAEKMLDLYQKTKGKEFVVSFAGHFSAGKSSMINALLEKDILPKSPIPTSANIVKINSGNGVARVFFKHEDPIEYDEPYDMDMIKEYCKNKDTINRIELSTMDPIIPAGCSIIDTPGIDAADDADRIITESSLHLVDVLYYVMDYNHVQSEVNLYFLKNIQDAGIPFYLVINQIDKHNETEIPFANYDKNIKQTFDQWGIIPEDILYSSVIDQHARHNQFKEIKNMIYDQFSKHESLLRTNSALDQILQEHEHFLQRVYDDKLNGSSIEPTDLTTIQNDIDRIDKAIEKTYKKRKEFEEEFKDQLNTTLKNAYLMPSKLRDVAGEFLESCQNDFKIGIIGAKKKTDMEKKKRINTFLSELQKSMETNIQWKLQEKFIKVIQNYGLHDPNVNEACQQLSIVYTENDLLEHVKSGAKLNGDYILNYTNDISSDIKNKFKQQARDLWGKIDQILEQKIEEQIVDFESEKRELQRQLQNHKDVSETQNSLQSNLDELRNPPKVTTSDVEWVNEKIQNAQPSFIKMDSPLTNEKKVRSEKVTTSKDMESTPVTDLKVEDIDRLINQTIQTVEELPGFQSLIKDLQQKQDRLSNRQLTIALFGAFSAGKSSFANALMGENVLPVSPNPTTAVINRINPITDTYSHGTVLIHLKDKESIVQDIVSITREIAPENTDLDYLMNWLNRNKIYESNELNQMFRSYLWALCNGFEQHHELLGQTISITMEEFGSYVTDEKIACYIQTVDLYYDCSITQQGITLVDTPGADSINARHTNVAFDYIKYADAILYVSYYNHALTRADKDFLMQLGRVKEAFQLDKMFFIINAADLAQSNSELKLVEDYVEEQLLQLGIRFPKIYPVSSKRALEDKQAKEPLNEYMATFEDSLYDFIHNGLATLTIEAAIHDLKRIQKTLAQFIQATNLDEKEKEQYKVNLTNKQNQITDVISHFQTSTYESRLKEKIEKQIHYIGERIAIRFHDMFKEMFNPTTVTESGKKATKQLERNTRELLDYVGYELLQEVRAVSLRIESLMNELRSEVHQSIQNQVVQIDANFLLRSLHEADIPTPNYNQGLTDIDLAIFSKALSKYKGTKSFFERNEKEKMKEEIYFVLEPLIKDYLQESRSMMETAYAHEWEQEMNQLKKQQIKELNNYVNDQLSLLKETVDLNVLKEKQQELTTILS
ncbi:Dynamin family protein [Oceanobacillus limi]|uniref:Dynamin family protein n=1 Tax=Oceanobacillus limi TaxID=930131 RepID=A0A1H9ZA93_9BACI|nr:dynamin family protein [Oceanobacillus limi]SES78392.1 Dynamin family protein [Oceanobacillus limi]